MPKTSYAGLVTSRHLFGPERLGAIPDEHLTPQHREARAAFRQSRGTEVFGPFLPLLWSPEVMVRAAALGEYLRERSVFPPHLSELMILIAARHWSQQYEWSLHCPIALQAGVAPEVADAVAAGRRPERLSREQDILYDLCTELLQTQGVSDATYARALEAFGERGVVEAVAITGYYSMLAMVLNTARTPPIPGGSTLE
ncbi:MAG: carboxymuconolactone decarboxylase family protein [Acidobacteria bacterium]|nr:carboxymuconolactone decarboxylase family protein [Acidobacteriota bacterium]